MTQLSLTIPDTVDEQVAAIDAQIAELKARRDAVQRTRPLTCYHCKQQSVISTLTFVQTHFYVQPRGCTGGDYWLPGEGQFTCPHCAQVNRVPAADETNPYIKNRAHSNVAALKDYFAKIEDVHE